MEHLFHPHHYIEMLPVLETVYMWLCTRFAKDPL